MAEEVFSEYFGGLFDSERFSDVTIVCEGRRLHAHKTIICTQSDFFAKACEGSFKEGQTGVVELSSDDLQAVLAVLTFLYTRNYSYDGTSDGNAPLTFHVKVFSLAEKYFISPLLHVAAKKFEAILEGKYDEDEFAEAVETWTAITSDKGKVLGNIIVETIVTQKKELLNPENSESRFRCALNRIPWLAADVAVKLATRKSAAEGVGVYTCGLFGCAYKYLANPEDGKSYRYRCNSCKKTTTLTSEDLRRAKGGYYFAALKET